MSSKDSSPDASFGTRGQSSLDADRRLDLELEQTFPASDPIPWIHEPRRTELYLEDLSPGQRFVTGATLVSEDEINAFAAQYDPQPFHLDAQAARASLFGGIVASGWHTAAITMRLLVGGPFRIAGGLIGLSADVSWSKPTRPGDVLRVEVEVLDVTPSRSQPDRGVATLRNRTLNQRDEAVQEATVKILVPCRSSRAQ